MSKFKYPVVAAILVAGVRCGSASAPDSGGSPQGSVSPPGRIAFTTQPSPFSGALYIVNSDGSGFREITSGPAFYWRPRWSPDRRRVVFARMGMDQVGGVYVIDVDGKTGPVRLADGRDPAWSPDGKRIVFTSNGGALVGGFGIHVMNADGTGVRQLTSPNNPAQCSAGTSANDLKPDWSPDGQKILFERQISTDDNGGYDCGLDGYGYISHVYVINVDGTGARRLRPVGPTSSDADPAWSPDGRSIAFSTPLGGLFLTDSEGSSTGQPVFTQAAGIPFTPAWSPDGKKLLYVSLLRPEYHLAVHELASGITTILVVPIASGAVLDPAWSR
jgi:TolB protein